MVQTYRVVLVVHVAAAAIALLSFWVAIALPKGSRRHLLTGRLFVRAMSVTLATAGAMSVALAAAPATFGAPETPLSGESLLRHLEVVRSMGIILSGITLLTASLLLFGARAQRRVGTTRLSERGADLVLLLVPGVLGAVAIPFERLPGWHALDGVGVMLVVSSALLVYRIVRPGLWLREHLVGMLGAGVVIHGAVATNLAPRLVGLEGPDAFLAAGPVVAIGVVLVMWACRRYTTSPRRRRSIPLGGWAADMRA